MANSPRTIAGDLCDMCRKRSLLAKYTRVSGVASQEVHQQQAPMRIRGWLPRPAAHNIAPTMKRCGANKYTHTHTHNHAVRSQGARLLPPMLITGASFAKMVLACPSTAAFTSSGELSGLGGFKY
jgi:hypothetical protein